MGLINDIFASEDSMNRIFIKMAVVSALLLTYTSGSSATEFDPIVDESETIGVFAPRGTIGPLAGVLTFTEAHAKCLSTAPLSTEQSSISNTDYRETYKDCMADYVPFKDSGAGLSGSCPSNTVSWSMCSSTLPSASDGISFTAKNTFNTSNYEGYANFECSGGQWQYVSGGCSTAVQSCEDGLIVDWGVTTPVWADDKSSTVFVDKFGVTRHSPKDRCYARMNSALSGELVTTKATAAEMVDPSLYNLNGSVSAQRCFNGEWLGEESKMPPSCTYVPKSCKATTYSHAKGCSFDLPSGTHDFVFESKSPLPQNSVGGVVAHCWDGEWEIKSSSCEQSCESNVDAHTWKPSDNSLSQVCNHAALSYSDRIVPGSVFTIQNQTPGLNGSASYSCQNGSLVRDAEYCEPLSCDSLPSNNWVGGDGSVCSHPTLVGTYPHGETILRKVGDFFSAISGEISYKCELGNFVVTESSCGFNEVSEPPLCYADGVDAGTAPGFDPGNGSVCKGIGTEYDNGLCCSTNSANQRICSYVP